MSAFHAYKIKILAHLQLSRRFVRLMRVQRQLLQVPSAANRILARFTVAYSTGFHRRIKLRTALDRHLGDATVAAGGFVP